LLFVQSSVGSDIGKTSNEFGDDDVPITRIERKNQQATSLRSQNSE